ncbi:MAG TPA: hypothetical protein H9717_10125 [Candidatus Eisenbergiella merdipullorum]|uniref:Extracellular solute-binding protein n=1 Tax=Candidatus Eisenbergiella merdipullorum TaxID=2838553 RepID=A0A9D2L1K9_9FIRM|nr:hypothetical protein [Candidatus Eisenbergiella merdipullorum]
MRRKLLTLTSIVSLAAMLLGGCGSDPEQTANSETVAPSTVSEGAAATEEGEKASAAAEPGSITYPLNSDITVSWYAQDGILPHEKFANAKESPFHTGLAEHLGVNIDWSFPTTGSDGGTYTTTLLADPGSLPNIMLGYFMNNANQYLDDGIFWDLTDHIQQYAPDYYAWLQSNPAYDRAMKTDDGRYYGFGFFREDGGWNDSYQGPVVRKDWLEECGLEIPKTISEFENVIRVFNEKYGATFNTYYSGRFRPVGLAGAFGAYGTAEASGNYGWFIKDGKISLAAAQPEWREYISWLNGLWEEGLIDHDILTEDDTTIKDKIHNDKCGISLTSMGQLTNWNSEREAAGKEAVWIGIPYPTADDGSISCIFGGPGIGTQAAVITKTADEETMKLCLQMLNYAYTEEGSLYWNYGEEGVSWEYNEEGVPTFTGLVKDDPDVDPMTKYNGATFGGPCIQATNLLYEKNSADAIAANDTWYYVYPDDEAKNEAVTSGWKWPVGATYTTEESDELDEIGQNISTYVDENGGAFLTGAKDIDDDAVWEQYLADLEAYNITRILEIRQACYDRYVAR